jgi:hypothetical protein
MAEALKKNYPNRKWKTRVAPYWLALIAAFFHPKVDVSWAKRHLRKRLYWDATPAENELEMSWKAPEKSVLETIPPILEHDWIS